MATREIHAGGSLAGNDGSPVSRGVGPGCGLAAKASDDSQSSFSQVEREERPTPRMRATVSGGFVLLDQWDGPAVSAFEFFSGSDGSHT
jgi:hypothetical protein